MKQSAAISKTNNISFEQAAAELEALVQQMELGNLALDDAFNAYKRGADLLQICQQSLNQVEQQIHLLNEANKLTTFKPSNDD